MKLLFSIIVLILEENFDFYQDQIFSDLNLSHSIINDENIFTRKIRCVKIPNLPHQKRNINIDYSIIR